MAKWRVYDADGRHMHTIEADGVSLQGQILVFLVGQQGIAFWSCANGGFIRKEEED